GRRGPRRARGGGGARRGGSAPAPRGGGGGGGAPPPPPPGAAAPVPQRPRDRPAPSGKVCATDGGGRVTATAWEHQREVREALHMIVSDPQLGIPALSNAQVMSNLLKDLLPDAPRETSVLVAAAEAGLAQILLDHVSQGMDAPTAASLAATAFAARAPFTPEACDWTVAELSVALGLAPGVPPAPAAGPATTVAAGPPAVAGRPVPKDKAETLPARGAAYRAGYAAAPRRGYGQAGPATQKSTRTWGIVTAAIITVSVLGGIIAMVTHTGAITTVEPLSQFLGPEVTSCKNVAAPG